jgi:hypothetical protein
MLFPVRFRFFSAGIKWNVRKRYILSVLSIVRLIEVLKAATPDDFIDGFCANSGSLDDFRHDSGRKITCFYILKPATEITNGCTQRTDDNSLSIYKYSPFLKLEI